MPSKKETDRAMRISSMTNDYHSSINNIYEQLVDREINNAKITIVELLDDLKYLLKNIEDDF
jgi:hypothetical protein